MNSLSLFHSICRERYSVLMLDRVRDIIGVIRRSVVVSAAEERGGSIPIRDFNLETMKMLKDSLIKVVEETSY